MVDHAAEKACPFCEIAAGRIRVNIHDEDQHWTSFPPLGPHAPGHLLFIPRRHLRDAGVEPAVTGTVMAAASAYVNRTLKGDANILTSVGADATQTVMHLHVHVIPRGPNDGLHHDWPWCRDAEQDEHLWLRDVRRHPEGEVRLYVDGRLVSGTSAAQVLGLSTPPASGPPTSPPNRGGMDRG